MEIVLRFGGLVDGWVIRDSSLAVMRPGVHLFSAGCNGDKSVKAVGVVADRSASSRIMRSTRLQRRLMLLASAGGVSL